ncbi:sigma-70 family RNA polymerase sigma factor [Streptomyces flaveolus]|uniref:RNA polymerase sigma factor n=1 Tax=Streptomyces flaveolus TaxID=67297 RepID=UPI0034433743
MTDQARPAAPTAGPSDALLAVRAREGDEDAFATLVRRHGKSLLLLATHMLGDTRDAEEAVQDAFVSAWRRLPEFRCEAAFSTWMYRITVNRCLNARRHRLPPLPLDVLPDPAADEARTSPGRAAEGNATAAALRAALGELEAEQRACWILREVHGLSYGEIAHATATGEDTVRGRLFRARRSLKQAMAPWR